MIGKLCQIPNAVRAATAIESTAHPLARINPLLREEYPHIVSQHQKIYIFLRGHAAFAFQKDINADLVSSLRI